MDQPPVSLAQVAALGAAIVLVAFTYRGLTAVARIALRELDYRAEDLDTWLRKFR